MDLKLQRPQTACSLTGRGFAAGEEFFSALVRARGGFERVDVSAAAWQGPPEGTIAWWRSRHPAPGEDRPVLAPVDALLDALEALEQSPADDPLRYLLALQLVRRRVLKIESGGDERPAEDEGAIVFSCRRRDRDYRLRPVRPDEAADPAVAARLEALLWSGEAA